MVYSRKSIVAFAALTLTKYGDAFTFITNKSLGRSLQRQEQQQHYYVSSTQLLATTTVKKASEATEPSQNNNDVDTNGSLLLNNNEIMTHIEQATGEAKKWAEDFDLVEESGAPFFALFRGIRSSAKLGLKGSPFYLKGKDFCKAMGGNDSGEDESFNGYFTYDDLAKALQDDFLDANRGSTDNRQGWKVRFAM